MGEYFSFVLCGFLSICIYKLIESRWSYKYRWTCPKCKYFKVDASSQEIIDRVKEVHTHNDDDEFPAPKTWR